MNGTDDPYGGAQPPQNTMRDGGFAAGSFDIVAYGAQGFCFRLTAGAGTSELSHKGALLVLPDGICAISASVPADITPQILQPLWMRCMAAGAQGEAPLELVLFGVGNLPFPLAPALVAALKAHGLRHEVMTTGAAVRTYHVLRGEERRVGAFVLPVE